MSEDVQVRTKHQVDKKKNIVSLKINTETKRIDQIQTENQRKFAKRNRQKKQQTNTTETAGNDGEGNKSKPTADWMWPMKMRRKGENPAKVTEASGWWNTG